MVNELLYADDLVLMSETMEDLKERFWNGKDALEGKGLKVNTRKTKMMVSRSEGELCKSKIDLDLEVSGKRKRGRPKKTWKEVEEETEKVGLKKEDDLNRNKWRDGVQTIAEGIGVNPAISAKGRTPDKN